MRTLLSIVCSVMVAMAASAANTYNGIFNAVGGNIVINSYAYLNGYTVITNSTEIEIGLLGVGAMAITSAGTSITSGNNSVVVYPDSSGVQIVGILYFTNKVPMTNLPTPTGITFTNGNGWVVAAKSDGSVTKSNNLNSGSETLSNIYAGNLLNFGGSTNGTLDLIGQDANGIGWSTRNAGTLTNLANAVPPGSTTNVLANVGGSGATVLIPLENLSSGGGGGGGTATTNLDSLWVTNSFTVSTNVFSVKRGNYYLSGVFVGATPSTAIGLNIVNYQGHTNGYIYADNSGYLHVGTSASYIPFDQPISFNSLQLQPNAEISNVTAGTVTLTAAYWSDFMELSGAGPISTLTVALPDPGTFGQTFCILSDNGITTLSVTAGAGGFDNPALTTMSAGQSATYVCMGNIGGHAYYARH